MLEMSIISSLQWKHFHGMHLTICQRDKADPRYAAFVSHIGEGAMPRFDAADGSPVVPLAHKIDSPAS